MKSRVHAPKCDGRLDVKNPCGRLFGDADGRVAGAGVNDDDLIGPPALPLYVREQSTQAALLVEHRGHDAHTHAGISLSLSPSTYSFPLPANVKQKPGQLQARRLVRVERAGVRGSRGSSFPTLPSIRHFLK